MSNIDAKIDDYKQMIADLEKQKKDEEESYKNTIEWNMEQLDKYVESIETKIQKHSEDLKTYYNKPEINYKQQNNIVSNEISRLRREYYQSLTYRYKEDEEIKVLYKAGSEERCYRGPLKYYCHIFEFVYKILKHLFTSNKKLSNDYDNVISRLDKLEEENRQLKTCQINYYDMKERLNIIEKQQKILSQNDMKLRLDKLEEENQQFKEKLSNYLDELENKINTTQNDMKLRLDKLEEENRQLKICQVNYYDMKERLNTIEKENKQLKETLSSYNDVVSVEKYEINKKIYTIENRLVTLEEKNIIEYDTFDDLEERLNILENDTTYLKHKLYDII